MHIIVALTLAVGVGSQSAGLGQCYSPTQVYAHDQHPCDDHAEFSLCCPTGWTCFSNTLCIVTSPSAASANVGDTRRGTCTSYDWDEDVCGNFCLEDDDGTLTPCGNGQWCCASDVSSGQCDCESGMGTFAVGPGEAVALVGVVDGLFTVTTGSAVPTSTGSIVEPSSLAAASSSSATVSTSSQAAASWTTSASSIAASSSAISTSPLAASTTFSSASFASASSSSAPSSSASSSSADPVSAASSPTPSHTVILAVSIVGGLILLALLGALIWYLWRRWNQYRRRPPSPDPNIYGPTGGPRESLIGPPVDIAPIPNPYDDGHNRFYTNTRGRTDLGLSQIRQDISGWPLVDPYARAAQRANSMSDLDRGGRWAGRGQGRGVPRRPVPRGLLVDRELPTDSRGSNGRL